MIFFYIFLNTILCSDINHNKIINQKIQIRVQSERFTKMLFFNVSRGGVKNLFFQFLAKNMGNRKNISLENSFVFFFCRHVENKGCLIFLSL